MGVMQLSGSQIFGKYHPHFLANCKVAIYSSLILKYFFSVEIVACCFSNMDEMRKDIFL
jgi:hypothetical protein